MIETVKRIHFKDLPQRPVSLRIVDDVPDKAWLNMDVETGGGQSMTAGVCLDRQALLDLRDCCDEILAGWFCPPDEKNHLCPVCEDVMDSAVRQRCVDTGHIELAPATVVGLDASTFSQVGDYKAPEAEASFTCDLCGEPIYQQPFAREDHEEAICASCYHKAYVNAAATEDAIEEARRRR
jgi:hypothetical protein